MATERRDEATKVESQENKDKRRGFITRKRSIMVVVAVLVLIAAIYLRSALISEDDETVFTKEGETIAEEGETYVLKVDDKEISTEVYRAYLIQKALLAWNRVAGDQAEFMEQEIDGVAVPDWIEEEVRRQIVYDHVARSEWDKLGVGVDQSDQERLDVYLSQQWEASREIYEENESDEEAFRAAYEGFLYDDLAFNDYIVKNPLEEGESQPTAQIASVKYFIINKYSYDGKEYTQEEKDKLVTLAEDYVKKLKKGRQIDEIYQNHLTLTGEDSSAFKPLAASVIENNNTEYTDTIPNFVNRLMETPEGEPFYADDEKHVTIGVRQLEDDRTSVQKVYGDNQIRQLQRDKFQAYMEGMTANVKVEENQSAMERYSPQSIRLPW